MEMTLTFPVLGLWHLDTVGLSASHHIEGSYIEKEEVDLNRK